MFNKRTLFAYDTGGTKGERGERQLEKGRLGFALCGSAIEESLRAAVAKLEATLFAERQAATAAGEQALAFRSLTLDLTLTPNP
jgi:hypothetical protein